MGLKIERGCVPLNLGLAELNGAHRYRYRASACCAIHAVFIAINRVIGLGFPLARHAIFAVQQKKMFPAIRTASTQAVCCERSSRSWRCATARARRPT